uniref:vicilin-like seed storage protein At2g18540 isoform X2 n=1 Tax=Oncorhynchus gorbuscha TaxID=8017 RepID=UPI001EAEBBF3|nr:vicilin-like seed storage protein At2g18540 isoform X2 [Oncorhynchus gorbuscha]
MWEIENTPRVCSKQKVGVTPAKKEQAEKKPDPSKTSAPVTAPIKAPKTQAKAIKTVAVTAPGNKALPGNRKTSADGRQRNDTPANTRAEKRKKIGMYSSRDEPVLGQKTAPASSAVIPPASKKTRLTEEKSLSTPKSEKTTERKKQEESRGRKRKKDDEGEKITEERKKQERRGRKRKKDDEGEKIKEVGVEEGKIEVSKMRKVESLETDKQVIHKEEVKKGNEERRLGY